MRYAIIDTESNGLFVTKDETGGVKRSDADGQPRMAAFAMILLNDDLTVQEEYTALVKPDGWSMTPEATAINGLTDEILMAQGKPIAEVMAVYSQAIKEGFAIAAFNMQHDGRQCRAEMRRCGLPDLFEATPNVCLMRKSQGIIPRPDGKKSWPKLEHCRTFLNLDHAGAHTAGADAASALAVFRYLHAKGVDLTPSVHYAKEKLTEDGPIVSTHPISRPRAGVPVANADIPE